MRAPSAAQDSHMGMATKRAIGKDVAIGQHRKQSLVVVAPHEKPKGIAGHQTTSEHRNKERDDQSRPKANRVVAMDMNQVLLACARVAIQHGSSGDEIPSRGA